MMRVGINAKKLKKSGLKYFAINRLKNYPCKVRQQKGLTSIDKKTKKKGLGCSPRPSYLFPILIKS